MKTSRFLRASACHALVLALALSSLGAARTEVWLSPTGTAGDGNGSQASPWAVPTATDFDTRMRGIPPDTTIRLVAGTFETHGWGSPGQQGFLVKNGWTIQGAGADKTVIRLVGCVADQHPGSGIGRIFFSGWGPGVERVVLRDLTADCNARGVMAAMKRREITLEAANLLGRELRYERVRAINAMGRRGAPGVNPEAFILGMSPRDEQTDATGYFIEDCEVREFRGGNCSAIILLGKGGRDGATGAFRRNRITLAGTGGEFAFGAHGTREFVIENNVTVRAARAFNWDTPAPGRNLLIRSNEFLQCTGWAFNLGGGGDSIIENNLIELASSQAVAVQISAANKTFPGARPWVIRGNTIRARSGSPTAVRFYEGQPVPGCVFEGNRISGRVQIDRSAAGFSVWRQNVDDARRPVNPPAAR